MARIGRLEIGRGPAKVMGIINASPESFYKASVRTGEREIAAAAKQMQEHGAHMIDVGAMSTAPYLETVIPVEEEIRRMRLAVRAVKSACDIPVSASNSPVQPPGLRCWAIGSTAATIPGPGACSSASSSDWWAGSTTW